MRLTRFLLCGLVLAGGSAPPAFADLPPLIPRAVLFGNPTRSSPELSPDGKLLAWIAPVEGVMNVWVRPLAGGADRAVTHETGHGVRDWFWQPDSRHILFLQDSNGDENWHLWQAAIDTGVTRDLTPFRGARATVMKIAFDHPRSMLVTLNHRDPKAPDVYRVDFASGAVTLDTRNPGDVDTYIADHRMAARAASIALPDGTYELRVRSTTRAPWKTVYRWPEGTDGSVADFAPGDDKLRLYSNVDADTSRLLELDLAGKTRILAQDPEYDVGEMLLHPATDRLQAVSHVRARTDWEIIDPAIRPDFEVLAKVNPGDFRVVSRDHADRAWIVEYVNAHAPVKWFLYDRPARKTTLLFSDYPALEQYALAPVQPVAFAARDGLKLHGYLTLPVGVEPRNLPLVLQVHGGPWTREHWVLDRRVQWLANRGYAVLQVDFRGSTGYGRRFMYAADREWGGKMLDDLVDAKHWAVQQGYADPARVAIFGRSYGGYAALTALAFQPDAFTAGISVVGPSNLNTLLASFPPYWATGLAWWRQRVGDSPEFLASRSPLFKADRITKPLLIAQGANDVRVTKIEGDQLVAAMRKNQRPVEYLLYTDEGHGIGGYGFVRPENEMHFRGRAEAFLAQHLGGRAEPEAEIKGHAAESR